MTLTFKKIRVWPQKLTARREKSNTKVPFDTTIATLIKRLKELGTTWAYMGVGLSASEMRLDGWPRANASASFPGVYLVVNCDYGMLLIACDKYEHWLRNLQTLAVVLDQLSRIEASGTIEGASLYRVYQRQGLADWIRQPDVFNGELSSPRIGPNFNGKSTVPPRKNASSKTSASPGPRPSAPPPPPKPPPAPKESQAVQETFATRVEAATWLAAKTGFDPAEILAKQETMTAAFRKAQRLCHPDVGGNPADFRRVRNAKDAVERGAAWTR